MQATVELVHHTIDEDPDAIFQTFLRDGAVVVEGLLSAAQIARLNAELDPYNDRADPLMRNVYDFAFEGSVADDVDGPPERFMPSDDAESFMSGNTRNVTGLATKSTTFAREILDHPLYMA